MNNALSLPPLVRGKVIGLYKFFVDEIHIKKKISYLNNESNILMQIHWWGEKLPAVVRPERVKLINQNGNEQVKNTYQEPITYEIRTTLNLFEAYLENCDFLEIVAVEENKNLVVGSAFLKNLSDLENYSNTVASPLVDHQGDVIGEVKVHSNLYFWSSENKLFDKELSYKCAIQKKEFIKDSDNTNGVVGQQDKTKDSQESRGNTQKCRQNVKQECNSEFLIENSKHLNDDLSSKLEFIKTSSEFFNKCQREHKKKARSLSSLDNIIDDNRSLSFYETEPNSQSFRQQTNRNKSELPQIQSHSDYSTIISIDLKQSTNKKVFEKKKTSLQPAKTNIAKSFHCKKSLNGLKVEPSISKSKLTSKPLHKNKIDNVKNKTTTKISTNNDVENEEFETPSSVPYLETIKYTSPVTPEDNALTKNVLDYLLGCDMSKEEETKALFTLMEMSPCQNFVKNISQFYSTSQANKTKCLKRDTPNETGARKDCDKSNERNKRSQSNSIRVNHLNFNIDDPVERKYYERFFVDDESSHAFRVAQILNQPEKELKELQLNEQNYSCNKLTGQSETICCDSRWSEENFMYRNGYEKVSDDDRPAEMKPSNDCCQYYKKLSELDKIIESLNHYEKKLLTNEKSYGDNIPI